MSMERPDPLGAEECTVTSRTMASGKDPTLFGSTESKARLRRQKPTFLALDAGGSLTHGDDVGDGGVGT